MLNAIEAMDRTPESRRILLIGSAKEPSGNILVSIHDSGTGLGKTKPEALFDAFYTTKSGGMGLGLTITQSIVEAHGGQIWAEPAESGGAIFRFTLPAAKQEL